jgi:chromosome segregation protein
MSLIDADDVLESGIDVVASTARQTFTERVAAVGRRESDGGAGARARHLPLRPAPFCLLDEVDAPLDEANVGRFTDKVLQMAADTQFIVITHNKRTMEMARALYGVTMEEQAFRS